MTLIILNAVFVVLVVYGLVLLLSHGIRSDLRGIEAHLRSTVHRLPERRAERLAA